MPPLAQQSRRRPTARRATLQRPSWRRLWKKIQHSNCGEPFLYSCSKTAPHGTSSFIKTRSGPKEPSVELRSVRLALTRRPKRWLKIGQSTRELETSEAKPNWLAFVG